MKHTITIAGGTGFIGQALEKHFTDKGHIVFILTRNPKASNHIHWDAKSLGAWSDTVNQSDLLINLTGKSVDCRYTKKNKQIILESRIQSTQVLNEAISKDSQLKLFINASSATIYTHSLDHLNTEDNGVIGNDFSMNVVKAWEQCFYKPCKKDLRKIALRMSIVLGRKGGAIPKLKSICALGLGGHQGSGKQWISWIHIDDVLQAMDHIIGQKHLNGSINITAPMPITNKAFMGAMRKVLRIPFGLNQSKYLLEIAAFLLRTETELLLKSRYVYPDILLNTGFKFKYKNAHQALKNLMSQNH